MFICYYKKLFWTILRANILLIPAAGTVNSVCTYDLALKNPAFINIGTVLAIEKISLCFKGKIIMAMRSKSPRFFELNPFSNVEFISRGQNIIETIKISMKN